MTDDERDRIKAEAFKEADLLGRLKTVEDDLAGIKGAVKWFFRALWGGVAYLLTQVVQSVLGSGWPK